MAIYNFQHSWREQDHAYYRGDGTVALMIGAGSYVGQAHLVTVKAK